MNNWDEKISTYRAMIKNKDIIIAQQLEQIDRQIKQLEEYEYVGNAIMLCATGKEAPLSDSDVCGVIEDLRAQLETARRSNA
jgi:hypothetical protein